KIGVSRETVNRWHQQEQFVNALHELAYLMIKHEWPEIVKSGLGLAKKGNIAWAKWLAELAGLYQPDMLTVKHTGEVDHKHSGIIDVAEWDSAETKAVIGEVRRLKAGRARTANTN
ncbi:unnamed protein product, partial [marine sediment metagenome]